MSNEQNSKGKGPVVKGKPSFLAKPYFNNKMSAFNRSGKSTFAMKQRKQGSK